MASAMIYSNLVLEKLLKEAIVEQARALYNAQHPRNHIWSVIVDRTPFFPGYRAYVVVYKDSTSLSCLEVLLSTPEDEEYDLPKDALEALLDCARSRVLRNI